VDELGDFAKHTLTSKNKEDDIISTNENIEHMKIYGRNLASKQLNEDNKKWKERQSQNELYTLTDTLGTFATRTISATHREENDLNQSHNKTDNENIEHMRLKGRESASIQLMKDKEIWLKRQSQNELETKPPLTLGHFASPTESNTKSEFGEYMKDLNLFVWGDEDGKKQEDLRLTY